MLENFAELIASLDHQKDLSPELSGELALWAARALWQADRPAEALEWLEKATAQAEAKLAPQIAGEWLKLAKKQSDRAEVALQQAAGLAPALAAPAQAQYYQRQGQPDQALHYWREAIRTNPAESNYYLNLARLYEQTGQPEEALNIYLQLVEQLPSHKNYLVVAQRLAEAKLEQALQQASSRRPIKIALLGNATLDQLQSYLRVACYRAGLQPEFYQGGFDQYTQEMLNPQSGLYRFAPEVLILAVHPSRLFPQLHAYPFSLTLEQRQAQIQSGLQTVQNLLDSFTRHSSALVLLHNMVVPQFPALGVYDWREELGQSAIFGEINHKLAELVRANYQNVYILDEEKVQARIGKGRATDPRVWFSAKMSWSEEALRELSKEYLRYLKPLKALSRKCIVLDLDNTLWGGVIGEDGLAGIQIGADPPGNAFAAFQRELEKLWQRGILLAISSKNNPEDVAVVFEQHSGMVLKSEHFAAKRINWQPKELNIAEIAKELNIGLDSLVFLDDNPVERAKVRAALPQVLTPEMPTDPAHYRRFLLELDVFDTLRLTEEDRKRNQMYAEQQARQAFEEKLSSSGSLDDYLAELQMVVEIEPANSLTLPRIAQLTGKTNQFNLTTRRYSEAQINEMQAQGAQVYGARVTDRFGDNGLTGVLIVEPKSDEVWEIDTLLLSCRVIGRGVETSLLAFLVEQAHRAGIAKIQGRFIPTAKNSPAEDCYRRHQFYELEHQTDSSTLWEIEVAEALTSLTTPTWLKVRRLEQVS